jgi:hypothetical protein
MRRFWIAGAVLGFAAALIVSEQATTAAARQIPINGAPSGPRTGLIVGQVVDATTGAPIPEAIVQLTMPKYFQNLPTTPQGHVMADSDGRFFFAELPAGDYALQASQEGYTGGVYGQRRVSGGSQLFSLGEDERRTDATLLLWKCGAIGGAVVDEVGEPVVGVAVLALSRDFVGGRARYGKTTTQPTKTDDRGMFRISGLMPGSYVVVAPVTETTLPAAVLDAYAQDPRPSSVLNGFFNSVLSAGVFQWRAASEDPSVGQPRTRQVGDVALLTMNGVPMPPSVTAAGRPQVYRTTYYPAAMTSSTATVLALDGGAERTDVNISLRPAPAVRLSGQLARPDGTPPAPTKIQLVGDSAKDVASYGFETASGMSDSSGRFTLLGVPPGEYLLENMDSILVVATSSEVRQGSPALLVRQRVSVGTSDMENLTVALQPVLRVEGRVEFHSASGQPPSVRDIETSFSVTFERPFGEPAGLSTPVRNGAFSTVVAAGEYIVRPRETAAWFVDSVTLDGRNVTDSVIDLQVGTTSLIVGYTDKPSPVSGTVSDTLGGVSATAEVLAFPTDPARWSGYGTTPRTVKSTLTTQAGAYRFDNLPPGEYLLIGVSSADAESWSDPKTLETLAPLATRLTVAAGEPKTLDLVLKVVR